MNPQTLANLIVAIQAPLGALRSSLSQAQRMVGSSASVMGSSLRIALGVATGQALAGGVAGVVSGMTGLVRKGVEFNATIETMTAGFEVMLGSAEKAKSLIGELVKFAAVTPFETPDLAKAATQLLATKKIAENQVLPVLKKLGDAAAGSADGFAAMPRITRAIAQMLSKGKITAQDMNQLAEAGIPAWSALAEKVGLTQKQLQEFSSQGKLGANAVNALIDALGDRFAGMAIKQSKTFSGLLSTIRDNIGIALGKATLPIFNRLKAIFEKLVAFMNSKAFTGIIGKISGAVEMVLSSIETAGPKILGWVKQAIDQVQFYLENWRTVFDFIAVKAAETASWLYDQFAYTLDERLPFAINALWDGMIAGGREFINQFKTMIQALIQFIADGLTAVFEMWRTRARGLMVAFEMWRNGAKPSQVLEAIAAAEVGAAGGFARNMGNAAQNFAGSMLPAASAIGKAVADAMRNIMQAMPGFKPSDRTNRLGAAAGGLLDKLAQARADRDHLSKVRGVIDKVIGGLFGAVGSPVDLINRMFGGGGGADAMFGGGGIIEAGKKRKGGGGSAMTGIAEMHSRIQDSINSAEAKDRQRMVKGIEKVAVAAEKGAGFNKMVVDGVGKVFDAVKGLNLGFGD